MRGIKRPISSAKGRILFRLDHDREMLVQLMLQQQEIGAMGAVITPTAEIVTTLGGSGQEQAAQLSSLGKLTKAVALIHIAESWMIKREVSEESKRELKQIESGEKRVSEFEDKIEILTWVMKILDPKYYVHGTSEFSFMYQIREKDGRRYLDTKTFEADNRNSREGKGMISNGRIFDELRK